MPTVETDGIIISSEIEGGNADGLREAGPGRVAFGPQEDPIPHEMQVKGPISCYVVCVQARNASLQPRTLTLDVEIPRWLIEAGFDYFLRKTFWARPEDALDWSPLQAAARWNTVSFLYQYTSPTTSHLLAQQRGPEVMQAALEICLG